MDKVSKCDRVYVFAMFLLMEIYYLASNLYKYIYVYLFILFVCFLATCLADALFLSILLLGQGGNRFDRKEFALKYMFGYEQSFGEVFVFLS